jgi:hypothetical protein
MVLMATIDDGTDLLKEVHDDFDGKIRQISSSDPKSKLSSG